MLFVDDNYYYCCSFIHLLYPLDPECPACMFFDCGRKAHNREVQEYYYYFNIMAVQPGKFWSLLDHRSILLVCSVCIILSHIQ